MFWPFFLVVVIASCFSVLQKVLREKQLAGVWPLYRRKVMSQPEQVLYHRLTGALPDNIVLAQVQLSRFLGVKKGHNHQSWLNRINRMSADFVVCNKDASIVAVIELDDSSHERQDRRRADAKKTKALGSAGVPLIRWT